MEKGIYKIYLADIRPLFEEQLQQKVYDRLPKIRQKKADACKLPKARAASLAAGFLMEYALKDQGLAEFQIEYTDGGAPVVVPDSDTNASVYISVSHSGDYAACIISDRPAGVDIQQSGPVKTTVLRHFFEPEMRQQFLQQYAVCPEDKYINEAARDAFLWQWAAKESYMKLTGEGMKMGFDQLVLEDPEKEKERSSAKIRDLEKEKERRGAMIRDLENRYAPGQIREYRVLDGYCLTVCIAENASAK